MEKTVLITLNVIDYDDNDEVLKNDIEVELGCCWHKSMEIQSIEIKPIDK